MVAVDALQVGEVELRVDALFQAAGPPEAGEPVDVAGQGRRLWSALPTRQHEALPGQR